MLRCTRLNAERFSSMVRRACASTLAHLSRDERKKKEARHCTRLLAPRRLGAIDSMQGGRDGVRTGGREHSRFAHGTQKDVEPSKRNRQQRRSPRDKTVRELRANNTLGRSDTKAER